MKNKSTPKTIENGIDWEANFHFLWSWKDTRIQATDKYKTEFKSITNKNFLRY